MLDLYFGRDGARLYRAVYNPSGVEALWGLHVDGPGVRLHHPELPTLLHPVSLIAGATNAPLMAARGSHRLGFVAARDAAARALEHEQVTCLAAPGDVWAYSTPILHASERAARPTRRRVLQVDYAVERLPNGLAWRGVAA